MFFLPLPGRANDGLQIGEPRPPAQLAPKPLRACAKHRGIAVASRALLHRHLQAQLLLHHAADLPDRVTRACPDVVRPQSGRALEMEGDQMRLRYIPDMNIIPQTGTVRSRVVMAIDFEEVPFT